MSLSLHLHSQTHGEEELRQTGELAEVCQSRWGLAVVGLVSPVETD